VIKAGVPLSKHSIFCGTMADMLQQFIGVSSTVGRCIGYCNGVRSTCQSCSVGRA
jgi:hypothetical protein